MNSCAVCDTVSKLEIKLPYFAPDEKLAFVERVCGLLIESRFVNGSYEAWIDSLAARCSDVYGSDQIIDKPRFMFPLSSKITRGSAAGSPAKYPRASQLLNRILKTASEQTHRLAPTRGSPL